MQRIPLWIVLCAGLALAACGGTPPAATPATNTYDGPMVPLAGAHNPTIKPGFRARCVEEETLPGATTHLAWIMELHPHSKGMMVRQFYLQHTGFAPEMRGENSPLVSIDAPPGDETKISFGIGMRQDSVAMARLMQFSQRAVRDIDDLRRSRTVLLAGVRIDDPWRGLGDWVARIFGKPARSGTVPQYATAAGQIERGGRTATVVNFSGSGRILVDDRYLDVRTEGHRFYDRDSGFIVEEKRRVAFLDGATEVTRLTLTVTCSIAAL